MVLEPVKIPIDTSDVDLAIKKIKKAQAGVEKSEKIEKGSSSANEPPLKSKS